MHIANEQELLSIVETVLPNVRHVLVCAPHPDDEIFGCGGALVLLREKGVEITVVILTDGAMGGTTADGSLVAKRAAESKAAAKELGLPEPAFWNLPDRKLAYGEELIERLGKQICAVDAELVFLPATTELHPDHQVLALAGIEALKRIGGERYAAFYEINAPLPSPNCLLDISHVCARKRAAMHCFSSQLEEQPYDLRIEGLNRFRSYFLGPQAVSAEAYVCIAVKDFSTHLEKFFGGPLNLRRQQGFVAFGEDIPLISIIVRSMDRPTLAETLASLSLQTYGHLEIVVVNAKGGKHTPLGEWCGNFSLRLLNQWGEGLTRSRAANWGLQACRGKYLGFLDDDDIIDPDHVFHLVQALEAAPQEVLAYSGIRCMRRGDVDRAVLATFAEPEVSFAKLLLGNVIPIHGVLFPAQLLNRGLTFDEGLDIYEDWDFWLQAARLASFVFVNRTTGSYFQGGDSGMSPLHVAPEAARKAKEHLYRKWLGCLSPPEFADVADHHQRVRSDFLAQLENCQRSLQAAAEGLRERESRLAQVEESLQQARGDLAEVRQAEQKVRQAEQELRTTLGSLLSSRSWRLTYPLRKVGEIIRKTFHFRHS